MGSALEARGWDVANTVVTVFIHGDTLVPENNGAWRLQIDEGATATAVRDAALEQAQCDIAVGVAAFAALFVGYKSASALQLAGLASGEPHKLREPRDRARAAASMTSHMSCVDSSLLS